MKKRLYFLPIIIVMFLSLVFTGCGSKKDESTKPAMKGNQTAQEASKPEPKPQEVIELKFNDWNPSSVITAKLEQQAIKMIEEKTNGRIKITPYFAQSLLAFPDTYRGLMTGMADISVYAIDVAPGAHALNRIFNLPFDTEAPDTLKMVKINQELLKKFPELQEENIKTGTKWIAIGAQAGNHMHTTKKLGRVPTDFKGVKMTVGSNPAEEVAMMNSVGAALIPSNPASTYENLQKGLTEAYLFHFPAVEAYKVDELLKNHTMIGQGGIAALSWGYMVNLKSWNRISPEDQKIIQDVFIWVTEELAKDNMESQKNVIEKTKAQGHTYINLTKEEQQKWYDLAKPEIQKWVKDTEAKGLPAEKIINLRQQLMNENLYQK